MLWHHFSRKKKQINLHYFSYILIPYFKEEFFVFRRKKRELNALCSHSRIFIPLMYFSFFHHSLFEKCTTIYLELNYFRRDQFEVERSLYTYVLDLIFLFRYSYIIYYSDILGFEVHESRFLF